MAETADIDFGTMGRGRRFVLVAECQKQIVCHKQSNQSFFRHNENMESQPFYERRVQYTHETVTSVPHGKCDLGVMT